MIIGDQSQTNAVAQCPAWMQSLDLREVDRLASDTLEPFIVEDRPVSLILKERSEDRKSEVRSLAARCLAYLDSFETLVKEFGDDRQRSYWTPEFNVLRQSLVAKSGDCRQNPQSAGELSAAPMRPTCTG